MFCPKCGAQLDDKDNFCYKCGMPAAPETGIETDSYADETEAQDIQEQSGFTVPGFKVPGFRTESDESEQEEEPEPEQDPEFENERQTAGGEEEPEPPVPQNTWYQQPEQQSSWYQPPEEPWVYAEPGYDAYAPRESSYNPYQPQKKKGRTGLVIGFAGLCVVILAAVLYIVLTMSGGGYRNYHDLIDDYFDAFEEGDIYKICSLMPKEFVNAIRAEGYTRDDIAYNLDYWYDCYRNDVEEWHITGIEDYGMAEYYYDDYFDAAQIDRFINVSADVWLDGPTVYDTYIFDFDLILVDGRWYLICVW